ncbi:TrmH family RNA methyltransferase [Psychroflexus aestuariivivens]|uniref:TrmH family RNA methyltransferase n=1 Tax=Psychroflexus aestuariivivens TaxID=1795040 RepID=UPI000FD9A60B|nr:RNA methyltransferase [Psychroflexus aestuariivivens]
MKEISSVNNPLVKQIIQLQKKSKRRTEENLCIIEGVKEIEMAISGNLKIKTILVCPDIFNNEINIENLQTEIIYVSNQVFEKIAYRNSTGGVLAIGETKNFSLQNLNLKTKKPLILVAEAPEKPGNIGAFLRTCDAAKIDAVIIANPKTDLYNPNIIRSSLGTVFTNEIASGKTEEIIEFLKNKNIDIYAAILQESVSYLEADFTNSSAIVVGTEAVGLSEAWRKAAKQNIIIPMEGKIDSMNVSVSAGILIFEAKRQRKTL